MEELDKLAFIAKLKDNGISIIRIEFSGSGDSGSIDSTEVLDKNEDNIDLENSDLLERIEDYGYDILSNQYNYDWYNNDGGRGTLIINIDTLEWNIDGVYYELIENDASQSGTIN